MYIYLKSNKKAVFLKYITDKNIENYYKIKSNHLLLRVFRKLKIPSYIFLDDWKKNIDKYDLIILSENDYDFNISKYIKKYNKNAKVILYFWNKIDKRYEKIFYDKNIDEFWTFDYSDSVKYKMKYNPQFYTKNINAVKDNISYDIIFLGRAKNRKEYIENLKLELNKKNILTNIKIIETEKDYIDYDEYLDIVFKSKAILDVVNENQIGLTLRCMESIFFEKKLITNNTDIVKYNFYNPNNIFILGKDNINEIKSFIDKPYKKINQEIIDYYDFSSWIKRFQS